MVRILLSRLQHACRQSCLISYNVKVPLTRPVGLCARTSNRSVATSSYIMNASFVDAPCQGAGTLDDVITRSKNSSDVQTIALELPKVNSMPARKRTFHLNHEDLENLVRPLLSCHWHVGRVGDSVQGLEVLSLNKLFSFKNFPLAVEFFNALAVVQDKENHHARVIVDYSNVYISTHTHVAYQNTVGVDAEPSKVPGLTPRDIRFGIKVERLHDTFLEDERAVTKVPVDSASLQAWSMERLRQRYPPHAA